MVLVMNELQDLKNSMAESQMPEELKQAVDEAGIIPTTVTAKDREATHKRLSAVVQAAALMQTIGQAANQGTYASQEMPEPKEPKKCWVNNNKKKKTKMAKASRRRNRK